MNNKKQINLSSVEKKELIKIAKKYSLNLFILFGSRAKGVAKNTSDYDFAYLRDKKFTLKDKNNFQNEILKILNYKEFDLIDISVKTPIILKMEILKNGIVLHKSNNRYYQHIKNNAYFDYVDSQSLLEPTKEKFLSASF